VRIFKGEGVEVVALQGLDITVRRGELIAVVGQSGSGKSTLLNVLSGLDTPTAGTVTVAGRNLLNLTAAERLDYRRNAVGFVFQQTGSNLLPYLTAAENIQVPMRAIKMPAKERKKRTAELLDLLELNSLANHLPSQLSGGQQQRVAIGVALANNPEMILADEPTGELDWAASLDVYQAFQQVNEKLGVTVIIVTHDAAVAEAVDRTIIIRDGRTASEVLRTGTLETRVVTEYALLDRFGRLQLPADMTAELGLSGRVILENMGDHVRIYPENQKANEVEQ
jgi:ABC-type lipoprotein export system ATPase subunit